MHKRTLTWVTNGCSKEEHKYSRVLSWTIYKVEIKYLQKALEAPLLFRAEIMGHIKPCT
jgi:hypothetical protein